MSPGGLGVLNTPLAEKYGDAGRYVSVHHRRCGRPKRKRQRSSVALERPRSHSISRPVRSSEQKGASKR
jgi:hypothetical protein